MGHLENSDDRRFMDEALRLAGRIPRRPWPNPPVGALVVREGRVVGRGAHLGAGGAHAEAVALGEAGALARGATLYCTLEPCNHQGRTPPCAPMVVASGVARVVVAIRDPNPGVAGGGLARLRESGVEVTLGVRAEQALDLVWPFACTRGFARPFVLLKTAASLDGRFAPRVTERKAGEPHYLTSPAARHEVHVLRRWSDLVVVGERTMAIDAPRLDSRLVDELEACPAPDPIPAYADSDLGLQKGWPRPFWVFAAGGRATGEARRAIERMGGTVVACAERGGHVAPESLVEEFGRRDGRCLMVEGGPRLAAAFVDAGLVDRWVHYVAPSLLGAGPTWPDRESRVAWSLTRAGTIGPDARLVFDRQRFDATLEALTAPDGGR